MWVVESDSLSPEKNPPLGRHVQKSWICSGQKILLRSGVLKFECHSFARNEIYLRRLQEHSRKGMTAALTVRWLMPLSALTTVNLDALHVRIRKRPFWPTAASKKTKKCIRIIARNARGSVWTYAAKPKNRPGRYETPAEFKLRGPVLRFCLALMC